MLVGTTVWRSHLLKKKEGMKRSRARSEGNWSSQNTQGLLTEPSLFSIFWAFFYQFFSCSDLAAAVTEGGCPCSRTQMLLHDLGDLSVQLNSRWDWSSSSIASIGNWMAGHDKGVSEGWEWLQGCWTLQLDMVALRITDRMDWGEPVDPPG